MKIGAQYSHLNGFEWIMYHKKDIWGEIETAINSVDAKKFRTKKSEEESMLGKMLLSPKAINARIAEEFSHYGWEKSRVDFYLTGDYDFDSRIVNLPRDQQKEIIEDEGKTRLSSYTETDFVKDNVAVEVQFGKYSFIAYDLYVKHLAFYISNSIEVGIEIIPTKKMLSQMSSGPGYYEKTIYELARQGRGVPAVPLVVIGIEP